MTLKQESLEVSMNGQNMEEKEIHLRDYLRIINKRRQIVYTFFAVVFVLVVVGTFSTTPLYRASTRLLIEKAETGNVMNNNAYYGYDTEFYPTQYELIKSSSVARKVVDMLGLDNKLLDRYVNGDPKSRSILSKVAGGLSTFIATLFRTKGLEALREKEDPDKQADSIAKIISSGIVVAPVKNSKIVDISYLSPNPELARAVANALARAYIEDLLDLNMSSTKYTLDWLTKKAEEEKATVAKSEKTLQEYQKSRNFVTLENKETIIPQKMTELNSRLLSAESKRRELEALYKKVQEVTSNLGNAENIGVIASDPTLQTLRQQIIMAEQDITERSQKLGQKHPALIRAKEDLASLKMKREQEIKRVIESIKNEYELAGANVASFKKSLAEAKGEALSLNEKAMEYGVLNREVETNRQLYDVLVKRMKEQSISEKTRTVNVLIIEKAELPGSPVKPRKAQNILLGLILGLFGGIGMAFFVEYLDQTVKSPDDAEAKLGVAVLGLVPLVNIGEHEVDKIVINEPNSLIAESFKAIRTALLLSSAEKSPKRILITSPGPGEGKTSVSINLASAIAQTGYSVLLIDADLRRPRIAKVMGLSNTKGLSTYLAGASDMDVIQDGPITNLSIITSGPIPPNPSELLGSKRMAEMIETLSEKYDIVICDSPPLLSVADSLMLDNILDAVIIVTRGGKTSYEDVRNGLKSLSGLKAQVLGIIINALDIKKSNYYYYQYKNYYYSTDETSDDKASRETKKAAHKKKA